MQPQTYQGSVFLFSAKPLHSFEAERGDAFAFGHLDGLFRDFLDVNQLLEAGGRIVEHRLALFIILADNERHLSCVIIQI